jgi:hypothetical protein
MTRSGESYRLRVSVCDIKPCTPGGLGLIWARTPKKDHEKFHPEETQRCHYFLLKWIPLTLKGYTLVSMAKVLAYPGYHNVTINSDFKNKYSNENSKVWKFLN